MRNVCRTTTASKQVRCLQSDVYCVKRLYSCVLWAFFRHGPDMLEFPPTPYCPWGKSYFNVSRNLQGFYHGRACTTPSFRLLGVWERPDHQQEVWAGTDWPPQLWAHLHAKGTHEYLGPSCWWANQDCGMHTSRGSKISREETYMFGKGPIIFSARIERTTLRMVFRMF